MNEPFNADVTEAIKKHLPGAVGDVLRKRLEDADEESKKLKEAQALIILYKGNETKLNEKVSNLEVQVSRHASLEARERAVQEREIKMEVFELKANLAAESRVSTAVASALTGLVRNTEYRSNAFNTKPIVVNSNGYESVQQQTSNESKTSGAE